MYLLSLFFLMFSFNKSITASNVVDYYARSYIVMDYNSGQVIDEKNKDLVRSVASISKLMTAYVAINYCNDINDLIVIGDEIDKAYGSAVYLQKGEELTLEELLYALLLRSGNDAALSIASFIGNNDISFFVSMMNQEARKIGMRNSIFRNPCGLDEEDGGNLSSSYEMALLMRECLNNEIFCKIISASSYQSSNHGTWHNKNKLLNNYKYTTGGKTGFTRLAKRTLVTSAKKDNTHFIVVTLDCGGDFAFHKYLYEKYFDIYENRILLKSGNQRIDKYHIFVETNLNYLLPKEKWNKALLIYKIEDKNKLDVLLVLEDKEFFLESYEIKEIDQKKIKISFWQKILNFFRRLFG